MPSASHDNWGTPKGLFTLLSEERTYGLDACADAQNTLCPKFISLEQDALITPWNGGSGVNVWCNPPYSMLPAFIERARDQAYEHKLCVTLLIPANTETQYFWDHIWEGPYEIRFLKGRLSFENYGHGARTTARFPSVLVFYDGMNVYPKPKIWCWDWKADWKKYELSHHRP